MVSIGPVISKSSNPFNNPSVTVSRAPITIGINVTFMFLSFSIPLQGPGTYYDHYLLLLASFSHQL